MQAILIFSAETWVMTLRIGQLLGGFHHRVARMISGKKPWYWEDGTCEYPLLEEDTREVSLEDIKTYISRLQNTATQYIAACPIIDLCMEAERRPVLRVNNRRWKNHGLDFEGLRYTGRKTEKWTGMGGWGGGGVRRRETGDRGTGGIN